MATVPPPGTGDQSQPNLDLFDRGSGTQQGLRHVRAELDPNRARVADPEPVAQKVSDLTYRLQTRLAFEGKRARPAIQTSIAELAPRTWLLWSSRREDAEFEHPPEFEDLRELDDDELSRRVGWIRKRKLRGLSPLDEALQREWRARAVSYRDLYGLDRLPMAPAFLVDRLRTAGVRSGHAFVVLGIAVLAIRKRRNGFSLSAPEARSLYGMAISTWWRVVGLLEDLGYIERVGMPKDNPNGGAPVHNDTNCYVPGPALLEVVDALLGDRDAAAQEHHRLVDERKARRRVERTRVRDRNRHRHHSLDPHVVTTKQVERVADKLAERVEVLRDQVEQRRAVERARAILRGAEARLGVEPSAELDGSGVASPEVLEELESRACAHVDLQNRGLSSELELPSELETAPPKGRLVELNCSNACARARDSSSSRTSGDATPEPSSSAEGSTPSQASAPHEAGYARGGARSARKMSFAGPTTVAPPNDSAPPCPAPSNEARGDVRQEAKAFSPEPTIAELLDALELCAPPELDPRGPPFGTERSPPAE